MELVVFEENKPLVLHALENGEFDYIETANEVFETEFFKYIGAKNILNKLAQSYPTPRQKEEVPLWFYIGSQLSMRLHGVHSYSAYPTVVRTGGMLNALAPKLSRSAPHPDTEDAAIACEGFNHKNHYDRQTPCDQDFLRKLGRDTHAEELMQWFNHDVSRVFRAQRVFDKEGIFIGDGSYIFVPDNPAYEGSARLRFDESGHPVSQEAFEKMSDEQKIRCQWKRCYKMVTLLHTNTKQEFFVFVTVKVVPGNDNECPVLYELVKQFVETMGKGVMKKLILDRGFLDGQEISRCKREYGVDILIPPRANMNITTDAMALFQSPDVQWVSCEETAARQEMRPPRLKPMTVRKRERKRQETLKERREEQPQPPPDTIVVKREAAAINEFTSWSSCSVPMTVIANRETYADGHEQRWLLLSTQSMHNPATARQEYHLRQATEERYRQLKCFADLADFTSRSFSLVVTQIVFTMLAYNLLQHYLLRKGREECNAKTPLTVRRQLLPAATHIIIYRDNYYGLFETLEFMELMTVGLRDEARKKIGEKSRRLRRELSSALTNPRPP
jgi:hypothetical protein